MKTKLIFCLGGLMLAGNAMPMEKSHVFHHYKESDEALKTYQRLKTQLSKQETTNSYLQLLPNDLLKMVQMYIPEKKESDKLGAYLKTLNPLNLENRNACTASIFYSLIGPAVAWYNFMSSRNSSQGRLQPTDFLCSQAIANTGILTYLVGTLNLSREIQGLVFLLGALYNIRHHTINLEKAAFGLNK